jgi:hypothetical protein
MLFPSLSGDRGRGGGESRRADEQTRVRKRTDRSTAGVVERRTREDAVLKCDAPPPPPGGEQKSRRADESAEENRQKHCRRSREKNKRGCCFEV